MCNQRIRISYVAEEKSCFWRNDYLDFLAVGMGHQVFIQMRQRFVIDRHYFFFGPENYFLSGNGVERIGIKKGYMGRVHGGVSYVYFIVKGWASTYNGGQRKQGDKIQQALSYFHDHFAAVHR